MQPTEETKHSQLRKYKKKVLILFNTMNKERVIEKNGYKVNILPIYKF